MLFYNGIMAQPVNDDCSAAVAVGTLPWTSSAYNVTLATTTGDPTNSCQANRARSIWFTFTPATTGSYYFSTCQSDAPLSTLPDIVMGVYTGSCGGAFTQVVCDDDACTTLNFQSLVSGVTLTGGTTYYIVCWQFCSGACAAPTVGAASISLYVKENPPAPANDNCAGAISLTPQTYAAACTTPISATTNGATQSNITCSSADSNDDVWFSFVAGATTEIVRFESVSAVSGSVSSMGLNTYTACPSTGAANCTTGITLTGGNGSTLITGLTIGTTYYLRVWTGGTANSATFNICIINPPPAPANDNCAGAISVTPQSFAAACTTPTSATSLGATQSNITCSSTDSNDDVWFSFVAGATTETVRFESVTAVVGTVTSMGLNTYTACPATGAANCNSSITLTSGAGQAGLTGLTIGTTYYLRVWTGGVSNMATFNICIIDPPPPPANDLCTNATIITQAANTSVTYSGTNAASTASSPALQLCGNTSPGVDVWYAFTATAAGTVQFNVEADGTNGSTSFDSQIQIFSGGCPGASTSCVAQGDDGGNPIGDSNDPLTISLAATAGTTYRARIYNWVSSGTGNFNLQVITPVGVALPLELASFTGKTTSSSNILQWETLTEKNVQSHIVERSVDGVKWMEVGRKAGQMESYASVKYELEDRAPLAKAYYRLRSVDFDGAENFSNTIVLTRKGEHFGITAAFPSPTKDQVTVQFASLTEENVTIQVMDISGRLVLVQEYAADNGINEAVLQLDGLQAGVYLVRISNATSTAEPMRIVKE